MNDLISQSEEILKRIANETDPLKNCVHYRDAADILKKLIDIINEDD